MSKQNSREVVTTSSCKKESVEIVPRQTHIQVRRSDWLIAKKKKSNRATSSISVYKACTSS